MTIIKRKCRWVFEGLNENFQTVFPQCFIKINEDDVEKIKNNLENKIIITQYFTMYDNDGEARLQFNKVAGCEDQVKTCYLKHYDACGNLLNSYKLNNVNMIFDTSSDTDDDDYIIANWFVNYKTIS